MDDDDVLVFSWRRLKNGSVEIRHHGRLAATLRDHDALDFLAEAEAEAEAGTVGGLQQRMARLTGNFKRGNERLAGQHPRNRRRGGGDEG